MITLDMKMMLLFIMINISFLSRQVVGPILTATSRSGYVVQLTCTSDVNGSCTTGSWLSNKTGITLGSCFQGCKSNIGLENMFHSNETSLIATIVKWDWTVDSSVWKCQCGTDTAIIEVKPPQTTTEAQLLESATTTEAPLLENATMSVTSSSDDISGSVVGGVIGGVTGLIMLICAVLVALLICKKRIPGRCLTRRKRQEEEINSASSPMLPATTPSREQPLSQTPHQEEEINSASGPMLPATTPSREQNVPQKSDQLMEDITKGSYCAPGNKDEVSELDRRHRWEEGNPDYLGEDRFSVVRRKLNQTMNRDTHLPS